ncbi:hypothetical protein DFH08DRAFT_820755 [Mycena albidolilacea]|uniref:Uncharacterized protein n=1 Tax=Mycena albidolilacea TaxID=1033008 RepID=A0AAD6ZC43_9AGAR|nr:hypothetical protein DFH08DRAFT_820755 [Mycena albidolilacea]
MLTFSVSPLVVLVSLAVPAVSLTNTSIPHTPYPHTITPQPSTWQELAHSHNSMPLILLASTLGWFIASNGLQENTHVDNLPQEQWPPGPQPFPGKQTHGMNTKEHMPPTSYWCTDTR